MTTNEPPPAARIQVAALQQLAYFTRVHSQRAFRLSFRTTFMSARSYSVVLNDLVLTTPPMLEAKCCNQSAPDERL